VGLLPHLADQAYADLSAKGGKQTMSAKIVGHVRKIKTTTGMGNVIAHNSRAKLYDEQGNVIENRQTDGAWYNPEWAPFNKIDGLENPYKRRDEIIRAAKAENEAAGIEWRKPQKNAAAAVEITLSFSHEWAENWRENPAEKAKVDEFMKRGRAFVEKKFPGTVLQLSEHFDEKTPHLHAVMIPITKNQRPGKETDAPTGWRYSSGDFFGGRAGLRQLQDELFQTFGELGLERGKVGSRAKPRSWPTGERSISARWSKRDGKKTSIGGRNRSRKPKKNWPRGRKRSRKRNAI
jgi:hypothetical protein